MEASLVVSPQPRRTTRPGKIERRASRAGLVRRGSRPRPDLRVYPTCAGLLDRVIRVLRVAIILTNLSRIPNILPITIE